MPTLSLPIDLKTSQDYLHRINSSLELSFAISGPYSCTQQHRLGSLTLGSTAASIAGLADPPLLARRSHATTRQDFGDFGAERYLAALAVVLLGQRDRISPPDHIQVSPAYHGAAWIVPDSPPSAFRRSVDASCPPILSPKAVGWSQFDLKGQ